MATTAPRPATITGQIDRVIYHRPDNGYSVFKVIPDDISIGDIVCVGNLPAIRTGDRFTFDGEWVTHPQYGDQFVFTRHELILPKNRNGIVSYLASVAHGVGPIKAMNILNTLGEGCLDIIRDAPEELYRVPGLKPEQADQIIEAVQRNTVLAKLTSLICREGVTPGLAQRIYDRYGTASVQVVQDNPYVLADDVWGVGFKTADRVAQSTGVAPDSPYRIEAAVIHVLKEAGNEGHVYLPPQELVTWIRRLLGKGASISGEMVRSAVTRLAQREDVRVETDDMGRDCAVYHRKLWDAEVSVSQDMLRLARQEVREITGLAGMIEDLSMDYAPGQRQAIVTALTRPISIVSGGPGVGKSTIIDAVCRIYSALRPEKPIHLAAPTGRAAKRMSEATNYEAKTIHRLLNYHPEYGFQLHKNRPLEPGLLVVDEMSMCCVELAAALFQAVPDSMQVVLVGDVDQLPSVGPGSVLRDAILSGIIPATFLEYNFRQTKDSGIIPLAHHIRRGEVPDLAAAAGDVQARAVDAPEDVPELVAAAVRYAAQKGLGVMDFQVICPMKKGVSGVDNLNEVVREIVNPPEPEKPELRYGRHNFRVGDKVMVVKNHYGKVVYNGDIGIVVAVGKQDKDMAVRVRIDGFDHEFTWTELDYLTLAYACTVHKSQGNEFPLVVGVFTRQHYLLLQRNLIYTAVTRAKDQLLLVHQNGAIKRAVENDVIGERYSRLRERLEGRCKNV